MTTPGQPANPANPPSANTVTTPGQPANPANPGRNPDVRIPWEHLFYSINAAAAVLCPPLAPILMGVIITISLGKALNELEVAKLEGKKIDIKTFIRICLPALMTLVPIGINQFVPALAPLYYQFAWVINPAFSMGVEALRDIPGEPGRKKFERIVAAGILSFLGTIVARGIAAAQVCIGDEPATGPENPNNELGQNVGGNGPDTIVGEDRTVTLPNLIKYLQANPNANLGDPELQQIIEGLGGKIETIQIQPGESINDALERFYGKEGIVGYQGFAAQLDPNVVNPDVVQPGQEILVVKLPNDIAASLEKLTIATGNHNNPSGYDIKYVLPENK